ncbi:prepilin peptidase [Anaeromicropila populeti]|uniref:prepilin peptidase n=1 Tax=Anaeromicropila populeti TaxID=37658 RepID=UPI002342EC1B|nr:prepilin peptidase [Anaeromicropila populeti]
MLVICAMVQDIKQSKVSNYFIFSGYICSLIFQIIIGQVNGVKVWGLGVIIPIVCLCLLFYTKMLGAGDIKLFSVIGGFYGADKIIEVMIAAFLVGALLALAKLLYYGILVKRLCYFYHYMKCILIKKERLFYEDYNKKNTAHTIHFTIPIFLAFQYTILK